MKLDLGSGPRKPEQKQEGWTYVDIRPFEGVDVTLDVGKQAWPWEDGAVEEVQANHLIEYLEPTERVHFFEELYRVLGEKGKAQIVTPHWAHERAYGDIDHKFPPVVGAFYTHLNKKWRDEMAPQAPFTCNFEAQLAGAYDQSDPWVATRTDEVKGVMMRRYVNTTTDLIANLVKTP